MNWFVIWRCLTQPARTVCPQMVNRLRTLFATTHFVTQFICLYKISALQNPSAICGRVLVLSFFMSDYHTTCNTLCIG